MIDLILENEEVLKKLFRGGLLSPKVFFYRNLYLDYDANIKMGLKNSVAISRTAKKFGVCIKTVYSAIKIMDSNHS
jgi:hypothetical protein